jgi:UDP-N-acetylglucosamine transferase subunit ALG13
LILVTVGTQLPFDRLIAVMDDIAADIDQPVFAQTGAGSFRPRHMEWSAKVGAAEFERRFETASLVVAHAGIGTILMAQRHCKPLVLFPRKAAMREHRNDHQVATVAAMQGRSGIYFAQGKEELRALLQRDLSPPQVSVMDESRQRLLVAVGDFIDQRRR